MATITLSSIGFSPTLSGATTVQLKWRLNSGSTYTSLPSATVNSAGNITSPLPYQFTVPVDDIVVRATNSCGDFDKEFYVNYCCPNGAVLSGTSCQSIDMTPAQIVDAAGTPITVCHYTDTNYSQFGTLFYKQGGYNVNGTYTVGNQPSAALTTSVAGGTYAGSVWGNGTSNTTAGRLNKAALWSCDSQTYVGTIGFGFQFNVPTTGIYYVGFGADNKASLSLDGTLIINQDPIAIGTQSCGGSSHTECVFKYWHCYPISLTAGVHLINVSGTNEGAIGAFGCEIYNASESVLTACTTSTGTYGNQSLATTNLNRYIVFSTESKNNIESDLGNYECTDSSYTLIKDDNDNYSCQKIITTAANICNSSRVGSLIAPLSSSVATAPIYSGVFKYLRCEKNVNAPTANVYQAFSNAGYQVVLTLNSAPSVSGNQTPFPTGSDLTTYFSNMDTFLSGNTYNFPLVCLQNEENNKGYWDISNPTDAANRYLAMLTGAIIRVHNSGRLITNGGITGDALPWMCWKDILDNQGSTAATAFAQKVFNSGQIANLANFPSQPAYQNPIAFLQVVIPAYKNLNLDFVNFHWYEPNHSDILGNTSIDPSAILTIADYLNRVTGKSVVSNEIGRHNTGDNIVPQMLDALMAISTQYIMLYDGDGQNAGTGDAYAFHNSDGTIRSGGTSIVNFLKTHQ